ncbi:MAG: hypothetical protein IT495_08620 [Gammaproteobacteria bacterium]|nr:hypothetical protein [Gammaproteobacteria bacterium]
MRSVMSVLILFVSATLSTAQAAEKLILEIDMDSDLVSLAHHIDAFLFTPTMNFSMDVPGNLSDRMKTEALRHHLAVTSLVRIDGEVAGFATEQEVVLTDPQSGLPYAESAWLITLNHPRASGVLAVKQRENAGPTFAKVQEVMANPQGDWGDEEQRFLSTDGVALVQLATGGLSPYQGGRFEEYNFVTPSDYKRFKRFRGRIEFVIYPAQ